MARFYGYVQGARGAASRLGHKGSGLVSVAASHQGAVQTQLYEKDGRDYARVELTRWQGEGVERVLYDGPLSGLAGTRPCQTAA